MDRSREEEKRSTSDSSLLNAQRWLVNVELDWLVIYAICAQHGHGLCQLHTSFSLTRHKNSTK